MPALEHSISEFIEQFKPHASRVQLYPQTEASPLLEVKVGGRVVYVLDRVGPYVAGTGEVWMIVNPMVATLSKAQTQEAELHSTGISKLEGVGLVVAIAPNHVVLEVTPNHVVLEVTPDRNVLEVTPDRNVLEVTQPETKAKLVLGVLDESWRSVQVGDWVQWVSLEPVHGFVVRRV
jgi:hypothetical protein